MTTAVAIAPPEYVVTRAVIRAAGEALLNASQTLTEMGRDRTAAWEAFRAVADDHINPVRGLRGMLDLGHRGSIEDGLCTAIGILMASRALATEAIAEGDDNDHSNAVASLAYALIDLADDGAAERWVEADAQAREEWEAEMDRVGKGR